MKVFAEGKERAFTAGDRGPCLYFSFLFFSREKLLKTDFFCRGDETSTRRGQQQTQLEMDGDNGVYRWHLLCLLFLFLSAFST